MTDIFSISLNTEQYFFRLQTGTLLFSISERIWYFCRTNLIFFAKRSSLMEHYTYTNFWHQKLTSECMQHFEFVLWCFNVTLIKCYLNCYLLWFRCGYGTFNFYNQLDIMTKWSGPKVVILSITYSVLYFIIFLTAVACLSDDFILTNQIQLCPCFKNWQWLFCI